MAFPLRHLIRNIAACAGAAVLASAAWAQTYPDRPITFIYGYPAGSVSDIAWRAIVQEASKRLGQPIVVENKPGANGRIGLDMVMRAKPDGYTIGKFNNSQLVVAPLIDPKLAIEPGRNYTPIVLGIEGYLLMVARPDAPFKDLPSFIAYAKANPGKLTGGSPGPGTGSHLALAMVGAQAGIDYTQIHYKGAVPAMQGLLAGDIDVMFTDVIAKPYVESGKILGLGVSGSSRWDLFPQLPTLKEAANLPAFQAVTWQGVLAPPGLPAGVATVLNRAFNEALASPELRARMAAGGWIIRGGTPEDAAKLIRSDTELYRPVVKAANIKLD
ncbi:Bug family tripartite tricarboxylate transporter substrate binding protein [Hydrogenophaga sp. BPS33]|uniref:Bug family tripartite tricarboxylate transporter substrate binding protein n=1 Tax=Hydrogenophaga sp. BPS33 TaxID=2651974 RepID=UPI00131F9538|nr:tripartite tricarboxylate transporter substrate binding protein [Hydrogenophaga sp. BPS33]QHE83706.1 tripartite tricarboxylate transporter substrate binding protein [Hydrogenophaga sp. BPS33]